MSHTEKENEMLTFLYRLCEINFPQTSRKRRLRVFNAVKVSFLALYRAGHTEYEAAKRAILSHVSNVRR